MQLQNMAKLHAATCPESYDPQAIGENIAVASPNVNIDDLMKFWFVKEGMNFDMNRGVCKEGADCDHFRYAAADDVGQIGCATQSCQFLKALGGPGKHMFTQTHIHTHRMTHPIWLSSYR